MPRKLRLEFPGAIYHIINRGNYRGNVFADESTKAAFEECLFEACRKSAWVLHAFVVMRNHFHLGLETPEGNLIAGMHWLTATFSTRFNRLRDERGHLFQGRYKSLLVGEEPALGKVCDYIHLNPVRAAIVPVPRLAEHRFSSYWYLRHPNRRPDFLRPQTALTAAGGLSDNCDGWDLYDQYLNLQVAQAETAKAAPINLSKGWAIGTDEFKLALIAEHNLAGLVRAHGQGGSAEIRAKRWKEALERVLRAAHRTHEEAARTAKSAPWKIAIAMWMKTHTQASNGWLSTALHLGTPAALSRNLTTYRRNVQASDPLWRKLTSFYPT